MKDQNCAYCMEGDLVAAFGIKICELPSSKVYLFKEQSHRGGVIVAHKKHVSEITELTAEERAAYIEDINHVAEALHQAFHPQKVNYGAYGDTGHHLHFHLVPKYTDEYEWGGVFAMNPQQKFLSDEEYTALIEEIKIDTALKVPGIEAIYTYKDVPDIRFTMAGQTYEKGDILIDDEGLIAAALSGALTLDKLEAMTCVCSVGLDMIALPGDTSAETIAAIIADEAAIGMINTKTTAVRVIPAPGCKVGDTVEFGGLLGSAPVQAVHPYSSAEFIARGGRIPAPLHSLKN